jgi:3-hydroxyacyl-CoA dehydrogenase/enoyl-CoA hydratase/3-hydroxybutyryl-CoA epimerase
LHFFNPVQKMALVEVIAAPTTHAEATQRARRFVHQVGKIPIVVKDSPGFVVNRILFPYLLEAVHLFEAGVAREEVDEAMRSFGMPMGPLRLLDEVGIEVALQIANSLEQHLGERAAAPGILGEMQRTGRLGRKTGAGFYSYSRDGCTASEVPVEQGRTGAGLTRDSLIQRMALLMVNEAIRCLDEEVVAEPADIDLAMVLGAGFPGVRGGPLRYADSIGAQALTKTLEALQAQEGMRFAPGELLRKLAARGARIYAE